MWSNSSNSLPPSSPSPSRQQLNESPTRPRLFIDSGVDSPPNDPRSLRLSPGWRIPQDAMVGYAGHLPEKAREVHVLESPLRKGKIGGYSGFVPQSKTICGSPIIPFKEPRSARDKLPKLSPSFRGADSSSSSINSSASSADMSTSAFTGYVRSPASSTRLHLLRNGRPMTNEERYQHATTSILRERNQTPEMLLEIVQSKFSERCTSYAQQQIRTRKLFEGFDRNHDGFLSEEEFRDCLEHENIQFDAMQVLALFAFFDRNHSGCIDWEEFAEKAMVFNPKGGNSVLPKMITLTPKAFSGSPTNRSPGFHSKSFSPTRKL